MTPQERKKLFGSLAVAAALLGGMGLGMIAGKPQAQHAGHDMAAQEAVPSFSMMMADGKAVTEKDFADKPKLLFFGFTNCPDVCPSAMADYTRWLKELGGDAGKVHMLLATVDPERDTPEQMKNYLTMFDPRIVGLSGTKAQVDAMGKAFHVYAKKVEHGGHTNVDHTASIYMLDKDGRIVKTLNRTALPEAQLAEIQDFIK